MLKAYKYRLYPNEEQKEYFSKCFGCSRFVYNKSQWKERVFHKIDKWFPSSQICSNCGVSDGKHTLDIREWTCKHCNIHHDRDINASINILNKGLEELNIKES
jgi:transposase